MHAKTIAAALMGLTAVTSAKMSTQTQSATTATGTGSASHPLSSSHDGADAAKQFPSPFPNVAAGSPEQKAIESAALGQIPTGNAKPPQPSEDSLISLGLIAFNELFEVAFFTELIQNITSHKMGYTKIENREEVLRVLKVVQAQEELHELNANNAFTAFKGEAIKPCKYDFPVENFHDAIALASTFTDVVLSTLPDIQTVFAQQNDTGLIRGVGSVIGQEGEQNGFYHQILGQVPSQLPFLTAGARDFAFNAILQNFVVPGSCPNVDILIASSNEKGVGLRTIDTLKIETDPEEFSIEKDIEIELAASTTNVGLGNNLLVKTQSASGMWLTYINQQNVPFSVKATVETGNAGPLKIKAKFPGKSKFLNGLTIASITRSKFSAKEPMGADDVAADALFGPALIEVNQKI